MFKRRIAVVGGGMGGLTIGIALQQAGYECIIFEQAPALAKIGAGINVAPNSTRIFRKLGLEKEMLAAGIQPRLKFSRDWATGERLFTVPVPELRERYQAPLIAFHRGALQEVLFNALRPGSLVCGKHLQALSQKDDGVTLAFADGTVAQADLVVGADGMHSKVRAALFGAAAPDYYGAVAYRSLIPTGDLGAYLPDDNTKWWAPDRYVLTYYTTEARDELNLVTGSPQRWQGTSFAPQSAASEELLEQFQGFHPEVQTVLKAARNITKWPMLERDPFKPWHRGSVVLLGDACHPTTPHMGQGAGMAIEDAIVLSRCIQEAEGQPLEPAFMRYCNARFERTARIQRESHINEWTKHGMDSDWVYGYDAFTVQL